MEPMKIDKSLNLVAPITDDVNCYHSPISREVFELNYLILSATKAAIESKGVHYQMGSGPAVASLTLLDEARKDALDRGNFDEKAMEASGSDEEIPDISTAKALLGEIKRLTTVIVPGEEGFNVVPVSVAIAEGHIDADDWRETESELVFFTCHYHMAKKKSRAKLAHATASLLKGWTTSLSATDYIASLPTSTASDDTQKT